MPKQDGNDQGCDAVVFVPGLGRGYLPQDLDTIGAKIVGSLERNSERIRDAYVVSNGAEAVYADDHRSQVRQLVVEEEGGKERVVADLYGLDYHDNLRRSFEERSLLGKCLAVLAMLVATLPAYLRAIMSPGKGVAEKAQLFLAGGVLGLVATYFLLLVLTMVGTALSLSGTGAPGPQPGAMSQLAAMPAVPAPAAAQDRGAAEIAAMAPGTATDTPGENPGEGLPATAESASELSAVAAPGAAEEVAAETGEPTNGGGSGGESPTAAAIPSPAGDQAAVVEQLAIGWHLLSEWFPRLQVLVVMVAGLGALSRQSLKELVSEAATEYVTAVAYIQAADRKQSVDGQLIALIEHVLEKDPAYRRVHLVGFSFGSLIALDTLFSRHPPSLHLERVDTLVTIGCPFDMVRTFWPRYFERRRIPGITGPEWINIYSRYDVLGSNFRDDPKEDQAEGRVTARAFGMVERPEQALKPENLVYDLGIEMGRFPLLTVLTLRGFKAHGLYWEGSGTSELSCFDLAMPRLLLTVDETPAV